MKKTISMHFAPLYANTRDVSFKLVSRRKVKVENIQDIYKLNYIDDFLSNLIISEIT